MSNFSITCLGGAGEVGMNLYVYESDDAAVIADYGIMFANPQIYGIDWILPDVTYLESIRHKLKAILFTHGHEDHVGGVVAMARSFSLPIYAGRFTAELIRHKTRNEDAPVTLTVVDENQEYMFEGIAARFFRVLHSIPDTFGIILEHDGFTAVHLSDFLDASGLSEKVADKRPDILLLDSTNACYRGETFTEKDVMREFKKIFSEAEGRIFLTTFASNVARLKSAIKAAKRAKRKIIIEGAAMARTTSIASRLGLLNIPESDLISAKEAQSMPPSSLIYLVSGCQGEISSALYSIVMRSRKAIRMDRGDALIFSSRIIPGNEISINAIVNSAMRMGAEVIQFPDRLVHVSGHASAMELMKVIAAISPNYFAPIHGEYRHLAAHAKLAEAAGMPKERCLLLETGSQLIFGGGRLIEKRAIPYGRVYVDRRGEFTLDEQELSARKHLARDGLVLISRGERDSLRTYGFKLTQEQEEAILSYAVNAAEMLDCSVEERLVKGVKRYFRKYFDRRPLVEMA